MGKRRTENATTRRLGWTNRFIRLKCAPDLLVLGMYPNAKEITESMSAVEAVLRCCRGPILGDQRVQAYVIGDGSTPRTGAMLAMRTRWTVHSIDPALKDRERNGRVQRLHVHRCKAEEFTLVPWPAWDLQLSVVVAVHSHAPFGPFWARVPSPKLGIAIPCCVPQEADAPPLIEYEDMGNASPCRTVKVWADEWALPESIAGYGEVR